MQRTLGFIGSGMIGGNLARLAVAAGFDVVLSNSREPATLADLVDELGPRARAATPEEAAQAGDLIVATVPLFACPRLPADALAGQTVIDTMNYYPQRDGHIAKLDSRELTSSALVQRHLAGSRVVKAFNSITFMSLLTMARPAGAPDRSALPIAGEDAPAKAAAADLLDALGYNPVDTGGLADSWRFEPQTPAYVRPYLPADLPDDLPPEDFPRWVKEHPAAPVPAGRLHELVASAVQEGEVGGRLPRLMTADSL